MWATVCANNCADMRKEKLKRDEKDKDEAYGIMPECGNVRSGAGGMRQQEGGHAEGWNRTRSGRTGCYRGPVDHGSGGCVCTAGRGNFG